jgi:hypothetical protein
MHDVLMFIVMMTDLLFIGTILPPGHRGLSSDGCGDAGDP